MPTTESTERLTISNDATELWGWADGLRVKLMVIGVVSSEW